MLQAFAAHNVQLSSLSIERCVFRGFGAPQIAFEISQITSLQSLSLGFNEDEELDLACFTTLVSLQSLSLYAVCCELIGMNTLLAHVPLIELTLRTRAYVQEDTSGSSGLISKSLQTIHFEELALIDHHMFMDVSCMPSLTEVSFNTLDLRCGVNVFGTENGEEQLRSICSRLASLAPACLQPPSHLFFNIMKSSINENWNDDQTASVLRLMCDTPLQKVLSECVLEIEIWSGKPGPGFLVPFSRLFSGVRRLKCCIYGFSDPCGLPFAVLNMPALERFHICLKGDLIPHSILAALVCAHTRGRHFKLIVEADTAEKDAQLDILSQQWTALKAGMFLGGGPCKVFFSTTDDSDYYYEDDTSDEE